MPANLTAALARALDARRDLLARLASDHTDAFRLFHGTAEGHPGLTVDRYGSIILVQSFHDPLSPAALSSLQQALGADSLQLLGHVPAPAR